MYSGSWGDLEGVIKCQMEDAPRYDLGGEMEPRREVGAVPPAGVAPAAAFDTPTKGTSVQKFREMILNHLKVGLQNDLLDWMYPPTVVICLCIYCHLSLLANEDLYYCISQNSSNEAKS